MVIPHGYKVPGKKKDAIYINSSKGGGWGLWKVLIYCMNNGLQEISLIPEVEEESSWEVQSSVSSEDFSESSEESHSEDSGDEDVHHSGRKRPTLSQPGII